MGAQRRDPRLGPVARVLSRGPGVRGRVAIPPARAAADAVAAREAGLRRLQRVAQAHAQGSQSWPEVRRELIDCLMQIRTLSLEVVETIESWRASGRQTGIWPDPHTGENYLLKMKDDTRGLADSPLGDILKFSAKSDPFFVVPSSGDSKPPTPTNQNQMTPTLQATRRQIGGGDPQRRAVLPLQNSLLRRIRAAELVILRESVQARLLQQGVSAASAHSAAAAAVAGSPPATPITASLQEVEAAAATYRPVSPQQAPLPERTATPGQVPAVSSTASAFRVGPRPRAPRPQEPQGFAFRLVPVAASLETAIDVLQSYLTRIPTKMWKSMESVDLLKASLKDEGAGAPEWFWLVRSDGGTTPPQPDTVDGLAIFRLKGMSTVFGQLLHLSVVDFSWMEDALKAVKATIFTWMPIKSIRATLWYTEIDGETQLNKEFEASFKNQRFRWFQLTNSKGLRGQVMNCPRAEAPEDPPRPAEEKAIEVCVGQAWFRACAGAGTADAEVTRNGSSRHPWSLALGASCARYMSLRDAAANPVVVKKAPAAVKETAREGLVRALLSGELEGMLTHFTSISTEEEAEELSGNKLTSPALMTSLAKALEVGPKGRDMPAVLCEAAEGQEGGAELLRRGTTAPGFADLVAGLGLEDLPGKVASLQPKDVILGRMFLTLDWLGVRGLPGGGFEVPVSAQGACSCHPLPVFYAGTSEDELFVVVIPWQGLDTLPPEEEVFTACTRVLRDTKPMERPSHKRLRFAAPFDVRYSLRTAEVDDPVQSRGAGQANGVAGAIAAAVSGSSSKMHLAEFSSFSVGLGREKAGRLASAAENENVDSFVVQRPFAVCLFHTDIDDLNIPLAAGLVI